MRRHPRQGDRYWRPAAGSLIVAALLCVPSAASAESRASNTKERAVHLADLPEAVRHAVELAAPESASQGELLAAIDLLTPKRQFESEALTIVTDLRWHAEPPEGGSQGPLAVLRRWPGDTSLALYALDPAFDEQRTPPLPLASSLFRHVGAENSLEWHGVLTTEIGKQPWLWFVRSVGEGLPRLGVLILPGDAGLGPEATPALAAEALTVAGRVEVHEQAWRNLPCLEPGQHVVVPTINMVPEETNENAWPWQIVSANKFTIGMPPGVRVMRLDVGVHPPVDIPGGVLWLRGRFFDLEGTRVTVGNGTRVGYVARVEASAKEWRTGKHPPLGVPGGIKAGSGRFLRAAERTGARSVTAERWTEEGFDGNWLVFRLAFEEEGYEIGLPLLEGWDSPSLFRIAMTWRRAGLPPAPPPIDFADRFGIRFEPSPVQAGNPRTAQAGTLTTPGLVLHVPAGIVPEPSLYSDDGYPIRFLTRGGTLAGTLSFFDSSDLAESSASWPDLTASDQDKRHDAERILENDEGWRLFVTTAGDVFCFEPGPRTPTPGVIGAGPGADASNLWKEILGSVRLLDSPGPDGS